MRSIESKEKGTMPKNRVRIISLSSKVEKMDRQNMGFSTRIFAK
jgi:hypothetical protein